MPKRKKIDRVQFNVRMREVLRAKIEAAARRRDVSMNAEAVDRLENSFLADQRREDIMDAVYFSLGGEENYLALRWVGFGLEFVEKETGKRWTEDSATFKRAVGATLHLLGHLADEGVPSFEDDKDFQKGVAVAEDIARSAKKFLAGRSGARS